MRRFLALSFGLLIGIALPAHAQTLRGAGAVYDAVTLDVEGPMMNERIGVNPFSDMRLDVTFRSGGKSWIVPGYFAGCADAAETSCTGGKVWRAHFLPSVAGSYSWQLSFRQGVDAAIGLPTNGLPGIELPAHGKSGTFNVTASQSNLIKARGIIHYTGEPYYRYSGSGEIFWKFGADSPENMLAYDDIDGTPNTKGLRKNWRPHQQDYLAHEARDFTWGNASKGSEILGMLRYMANQNMNGVSALTWNTSGDDRNVFPHLLAVEPSVYEKMEPADQWRLGVVQDRFDVSKLAQWQRVFAYADSLGLHINFKLQEIENDRLMDNGQLGRARKLYLREMIARFGHYLGATWNLGEENSQHIGDARHMSHYVDALDAYDRPIVIHSYPSLKDRHLGFLGDLSALNGLSLQSQPESARSDIARWRLAAQQAGRPWVMSFDEQGTHRSGTGVDDAYPIAQLPLQRNEIVTRAFARRMVIWNALTAGANGGEAYYGYETGCTDLNCQDQRTRASLWKDAATALDFFRTHIGERALNMNVQDHITPQDDLDFVFGDPGQIYVIVPSQPNVAIQFAQMQGRFSVAWYDMVVGGALQQGSITMIDPPGGHSGDFQGGVNDVDIGTPPTGGSGDWVALIKRMDDESILVEAENFITQTKDQIRKWHRVDATQMPPSRARAGLKSASGGQYVSVLPDTRILHQDALVHGENFTEMAGSMAVLSYEVNFPAAGRYYVWTRIYSTGNEDNGLHIGLNGTWPESGQRVQFCPGKQQWYWDNRQRTDGQHCGVRGGIWLDVPSAGKHKVEVSMREDGVKLDALYLTRDALPPRALMEENARLGPPTPIAGP